MFRYSISWYIFTFSFFELIIKTHLTVHDSSHGFISNNARYFDDEFSTIQEEITGLHHKSDLNDVPLNFLLKFEPSFLDFKQRPIGIPYIEKVTLYNIDNNKSIDMTSISGNTVHFHSSFFEDKRILPMGNTSFNVVFLGREEGYVESNLFIHTSEGFLKYSVKGASIYNQYRLRPIVGVKCPINSTFSPFIFMHNPHPEPIQIVEVYSSGGDFILELPSGQSEASNEIWEIPPLQTRPIIKILFQAKNIQNHTAYVRIKLNRPNEVLIVPLEVEITASGGIVHPQGYVDFGMGGSTDYPKEKKLCVFNTNKKAIKIHSVSTSSKAIHIEYENSKLQPKTQTGKDSECVEIATLKLDWETAYKTEDFAGKIIIKYRNGRNRSEIPYYTTVLKGGISYDPYTTKYFVDDKFADVSTRNFKVKNDHLFPLQITGYSMPEEAKNLFSIQNFKSLLINPQQEAIIFTIKLNSGVKLTSLNINTHMVLKTNVSDITIPLLCYDGRLELILPFKSKDYSLDLGLMSFDMKKEIYFLIVNHNPVNIILKKISSSIPMTVVEIFGCGRDNYKSALLQISYNNLSKCMNLEWGNYALVRLTVHTLNTEGQMWGDIQLETQYENLSIPVHFKVAAGKLEIGPDRLVFDQCFPGKICSHPLRVHSTFNDPMVIEDILSLPPDRRLSTRHSGHILAHASKIIGHLYLDPTLACFNQCYTGMQHETTAQWLKTFSLSKYVSDFDAHMVNLFYARYMNLTSNGLKKWQNLTLRLDTSEVRGHIFKTRVKMSWPSLILEPSSDNKSIFVFPLTQIGNVTYKNITIRNPSSYNLAVQLVLENDYPNLKSLYENVPEKFIPQHSMEFYKNAGFFFHKNYMRVVNTFKRMLNVNVSENSFPLLLYPGQNFSVILGFRAEDEIERSSLLLIRSNLTILEIVRLKGQGTYPSFKFGNRRPGSMQPLSFEMTEKHFKDCDRDSKYTVESPNFTVRRSFTARNMGGVTIYVHSFHINDLPCEGYGFKVINCVPFVLPRNSTKKIDIAFTPDLTLTRVTRMLILETSLNEPVNYTLFTTVPYNYLHSCSDAISRPIWELYLSYLAITMMFILFIIIIFIALMDAEKINKHALNSFMSPTNSTIRPVLDLRLVGQQTREEIQTAKPENCDKKCNSNHKDEQIQHKEVEKYSAVVPTTGKSKRKLAKKNSNEISDGGSSISNKNNNKHCDYQKSSKGLKPDSKKNHGLKEGHKKSQSLLSNSNNKKNNTKNTIVPVLDDHSPVSTDGSHEDLEKENNQRNATKNCSKKYNISNNKSDSSKSNSIEEDLNISNTAEIKPVKLERQKSGTKLNHNNNNKIKDKDNSTEKSSTITTIIDHQVPSKTSTGKEHKTRGKNGKERNRDRQSNKKNNNTASSAGNGVEKLSSKTSSDSNKNLNQRSSPPVSSPVWGENRAKFSDVVARNDQKPLCQTTNFGNKPTMFVEPYKNLNTELGPIGSRRVDYYMQEDNGGDGNGSTENSNSFFSPTLRLNAQTFFEDYMGTEGSNWNGGDSQNLMELIESSICHQQQEQEEELTSPAPTMEDPWNENLLNTNAYWNSTFITEALNENPPMTRAPGYLWGSSPVWQTWAPPEVPRTPTRTPPGFDEYVQRNRDDQTAQQRDTYGPFITSSIWTQPENNPWTYNTNHEQ